MQTRKQILESALALTLGERNQTHGDPVAQHNYCAGMWSAYLGIPITGTDVANLMTLLKMSRYKMGSAHPDHFIDGAGYQGIAGECASCETVTHG